MSTITVFNATQVYKANEFIAEVRAELKTIEKSFFTIGYKLNEAKNKNLHQALGYSDIYELAEKEFEIGRTTTKNLMLVNMQFGESGNKLQIQDKYKNYNQSQLVEMASIGPSLLDCIDPDFTRDEIRTLKKVYDLCYTHKSQEIFNQNFNLETAQLKINPRKYIKLYNEYKKKNPSEKKSEEKTLPVDGQLVFNDDATVTEFHYDGAPTVSDADHKEKAKQSLAELFKEADETDPSETFKSWYSSAPRLEVVDAKTYPHASDVVKHFQPKLHNFKNVKEREAFINDDSNFDILVLENEELNLKVKRLDFANGAKLYKIYWKEYSTWREKIVERSKFCLVADNELKDANNCTFSTKCFNIDGTAPTYVINYMTKESKNI